ncbi:hypothetical protein [Actinacidiphila soli]|uniref:hypothetical protein n=1 Tax=Actinacidiphila soli TaxID=2487275 RepID=UPI0013E2BF0E|nr:hypothetical protein [Actinacidiphila soli]
MAREGWTTIRTARASGAVTATRKIGGITDTPDLTAVEPLLLTRDSAGGFTTRLDNAARYVGR